MSDLGNVRNNTSGRIMKTRIQNGYIILNLFKDDHRFTKKIHRLVAGAFIPNPENKPFVDHKDNQKNNNILSYLRWATRSENNQNVGLQRNNTSGVKGVVFDKRLNKWKATLMLDGISIHLGYFDNLEDAKQARMIKANEAFGVFIHKIELIK